LKKLFNLAAVPDGHAHRFRDTFSVELLLAGVPIEDVSILLGHKNIKITQNITLHGSAIAKCGSKRTSSERGIPIRSSIRKSLEIRTEISPVVCQTRSDHPKSFSPKPLALVRARRNARNAKNAQTGKIRLRGGYAAR
jgi:hypothetical protein